MKSLVAWMWALGLVNAVAAALATHSGLPRVALVGLLGFGAALAVLLALAAPVSGERPAK